MAGGVSGCTTDDAELQAVLAKVAKVSLWTDAELVTANGRRLLANLANQTPKVTGKGRAGWWPSWTGLGMTGSPRTRRQFGPETIKKGKRELTYVSDGAFDDRRTWRGMPSVTFRNRTYLLNKEERRVNYLYLSTQRGKNSGWLELAKNMTRWQWEKSYDRLLARASRGQL